MSLFENTCLMGKLWDLSWGLQSMPWLPSALPFVLKWVSTETFSPGSMYKDTGQAVERLPDAGWGFLQWSVSCGVNETMWVSSWCPFIDTQQVWLHYWVHSWQDESSLGAVGAGESSAIPKTSWWGRNDSDLKKNELKIHRSSMNLALVSPLSCHMLQWVLPEFIF